MKFVYGLFFFVFDELCIILVYSLLNSDNDCFAKEIYTNCQWAGFQQYP